MVTSERIPHKTVCCPASDGYGRRVVIRSCTAQRDSRLYPTASCPPICRTPVVRRLSSMQNCTQE